MSFTRELIDIKRISEDASAFCVSEPTEGEVVLLLLKGGKRILLGAVPEGHPTVDEIVKAFALANTAISEVRAQYRKHLRSEVDGTDNA